MIVRYVVPLPHPRHDVPVTTQIWGKDFSGGMKLSFLRGPLFVPGLHRALWILFLFSADAALLPTVPSIGVPSIAATPRVAHA